jgi:hypothetical protein
VYLLPKAGIGIPCDAAFSGNGKTQALLWDTSRFNGGTEVNSSLWRSQWPDRPFSGRYYRQRLWANIQAVIHAIYADARVRLKSTMRR